MANTLQEPEIKVLKNEIHRLRLALKYIAKVNQPRGLLVAQTLAKAVLDGEILPPIEEEFPDGLELAK